jgi:hypothetical protein
LGTPDFPLKLIGAAACLGVVRRLGADAIVHHQRVFVATIRC